MSAEERKSARAASTLTRETLLISLALFLCAAALYAGTAARGLTWANEGGDAGDFLAAAHTWGVPHPTGYPAYVLALRAFIEVAPLGDMAFRGNLMSALFGAAAVPFVFLSALRIFLRIPTSEVMRWRLPLFSALLSATVFAVSHLHWSQATITEVYALNAFLAAVLLWITTEARARINSGGQAIWFRVAWALLLGIGLGNHISLAVIAAPLAVWMHWPLWKRDGFGAVLDWRPVLAFFTGLLVYIYPPIASAQDPFINWGQPHTLEGFRWMITASLYQSYVFGLSADFLPDRILGTAELLLNQYTIPGAVIGFAGLSVLWSSMRGFVIASGAASAAIVVYSIGYNTFDSFVYLIPVFMFFAIWIGAGAMNLTSTLSSTDVIGRVPRLAGHVEKIPAAVMALLMLLPVYLAIANYGDLDLSSDTVAQEYVSNALESAGQRAVILTGDPEIYSLWYQSVVEEPEREVLVVAVPLLGFDWYWDQLSRHAPDRIPANAPTALRERVLVIARANLGLNPVLLTSADNFYGEYFELEEAGVLYRLIPD
ncbi:MAG: DUF2723 domain-containing protein [Dehalococcoidia bacterium]